MNKTLLSIVLLVSTLTLLAVDCNQVQCQSGGGNKLVVELPSKLFEGQRVVGGTYVIDSVTGIVDTSYSGTLNMLIHSGPGSIIPPSTVILDPSATLSFGIDIPGNYEIIFRADGLDDDTLFFPVYDKVDCDGVACNEFVEATSVDLTSDPDLIVADAATLLLVSALNDSSGLFAGSYIGSSTINVISGPGELLGNNIVFGNYIMFFSDMIFTEAGQYQLEVILQGVVTDTFRINVLQSNGVLEIAPSGINVFPNPLEKGQPLIIDAKGDLVEAEMFNLEGKMVYSRIIDNSEETVIIQEVFRSGIYFIRITDTQGNQSFKKLIVK
jgi:hypothetical protein